jgi:tetraacyldisaccharide 4'-kinase
MPPVHAPDFWSRGGLVPTVLQPLAALYAAAGSARRALTAPTRVGVPVLCIGNLVTGGAGKTPVTLSLAARLSAAGHRPHILTRGYGGTIGGPVRVDPANHDAAAVGDVARLLARAAPCWVGRDRVAAAVAAIAAGADLLLLDDGFQNPRLAKDLSLIVVDGSYGFGNRRVMPAGPLREPIAAGLARAAAAVVLGTDASGSLTLLGDRLPVLLASLVSQGADDLRGKPVVAFAGIGRPAKFFATLDELGARIVARHEFPDHHRYRESELRHLLAAAKAAGAQPVSTAKDWVRLPSAVRSQIRAVEVAVEWREPRALDRLLDALLAAHLVKAAADG